ncbi:MAG: 1-(5-phosphoribosyl)-5-[(5-phosphoribosylamino)methylideneamino]imidazole-4-carboxamide isomerase [Gemmatimonadota bacterium]|nr:1-(5-phosphoribosyl)-5-[(5-phosphoribosylamino)methylideneamino]imidazole-4-carboxamide isomerase [Gemmatimonadota bacterium]
MQVIPAVDLREGKCVQLIGGSYEDERIRLDDPVAVAAKWEEAGFRRVHVVDLDAATGKGTNRALVEEIIRSTAMTVQVGGGIRDIDAIEELLGFGASAVVLGTRAIENRDWLEEASARFPGRIIVAADVKERNIVTRGWTESLALDVADAVRALSELPLAGLLITAVHREGLMSGPDIDLMREMSGETSLPLQASGGIGSEEDLRELAEIGIASAVVGMALYTGALDVESITREFAL